MIVNTANKCKCCVASKYPVRLEILKVYNLSGAYYDYDDYECWRTSGDTTVSCQVVYSDDSVFAFSSKMQHINQNIDFANGKAVVVWQNSGITAGVTETWIRADETTGIYPLLARPTNFDGYVARIIGAYRDAVYNVYANLSLAFSFTPQQDGVNDDGNPYFPINFYNADGSAIASCPFERVVIVDGVEK